MLSYAQVCWDYLEWNSCRIWIANRATFTGVKEYSEWPTIPQLYLEKEFIGGCDILMSMHQNGELAKLLETKGVLVAADE